MEIRTHLTKNELDNILNNHNDLIKTYDEIVNDVNSVVKSGYVKFSNDIAKRNDWALSCCDEFRKMYPDITFNVSNGNVSIETHSYANYDGNYYLFSSNERCYRQVLEDSYTKSTQIKV